MSSLNDVVAAMCKETDGATLGWDVVVNYTAKEMSELLKAAYDEEDHRGQLMELPVQVNVEDLITGDRYIVDYVFKLGAPLIQFKGGAMVPACELEIPVIGGSAKIVERQIEQVIDAGLYRLFITGIALASVNTNDVSRNLKPGHEAFVFDSHGTTGAVTLDFDTSASQEWLRVDLKGRGVRLVDGTLAILKEEILNFFRTAHHNIHWDLAQVNNRLPSNSVTQFVPERFRFAAYDAKDYTHYSILSIFIHVEGSTHGGKEDHLQDHWGSKWSNYGVPPIPQLYTASVIISRERIKKIVENSVHDPAIPMMLEEPRMTGDTWSMKWRIILNKSFKMKQIITQGNPRYWVEELSVDLNVTTTKGFFIIIGQNGGSGDQASALLEWEFAFDVNWGLVDGEKKGKKYIRRGISAHKYIDQNSLTDYKVRLDAGLKKSDWPPLIVSGDEEVWSSKEFLEEVEKANPEMPVFDLELFDIDFLLTTNLLLPNQKVIAFDAEPGARFPQDLYLVGQIMHKAKVDARRAARALAS